MVLLAFIAVLGPLVADTYLGGPAAWGVIGTCMTIGMVCAQFTAGRIKPKRPVVFIAWLPPRPSCSEPYRARYSAGWPPST